MTELTAITTSMGATKAQIVPWLVDSQQLFLPPKSSQRMPADIATTTAGSTNLFKLII